MRTKTKRKPNKARAEMFSHSALQICELVNFYVSSTLDKGETVNNERIGGALKAVVILNDMAAKERGLA